MANPVDDDEVPFLVLEATVVVTTEGCGDPAAAYGADRAVKTTPSSGRVGSLQGFALGEILRHARAPGMIDLALGIPELPVDDRLRRAACDAIIRDENQYADPVGLLELRRAIAEGLASSGMEYSADDEITVTTGATEGLVAALLGIIDPGDEVALLDPYYENHLRAVRLAGARCRITRVRPPDWRLTPGVLEEAIGPRTKVLLLSSPANPTGAVLSLRELELLAEVCNRSDVTIVCDETYRAFVFDGEEHRSPGQLRELRDRSVVLRSFSKSHLVSGWRIGYAAAPRRITAGLRKAHDTICCGAPAPFQRALASTFREIEGESSSLRRFYQEQRDRCIRMLDDVGLRCFRPRGGIFLFAALPPPLDSRELARRLIDEAGVVLVPGVAFTQAPDDGASFLRCCFAKTDATVAEAERRLARWAPSGGIRL
jgi:N-succinyldiaminopimelate aminotransferase